MSLRKALLDAAKRVQKETELSTAIKRRPNKNVDVHKYETIRDL